MTVSAHKRPRWVAPLLALIVVKGVLFALLVPPWLGPDEGLRLEYARLFSQSGFTQLTPVSDERNQAEVLSSMTRFGVWKFMDLPEPTPKGLQRFVDSPLQKDTPSTTYPPLYYLVLGNFWRVLGIDGLLPQLYSGRVLSLLLGCAQLMVLAILTAYCWPVDDGWGRLCALVFMAFLPQWSYLGAMVHADNLANLLAAAFFLCFVQVVSRMGRPRDVQGAHDGFDSWSMARSAALLIMLLLALVLSTRAAAIVVVSVLATAAVQLMWRGRTVQRRTLRWVLVAVGGILVVLVAWLTVVRDPASTTGIQEAIGRGLMQRGAELPTEVGGTLLTRLAEVTPGGLIRSAAIMFMTFWLALGTLVHKLQPGWLVAVGMVCLLCLYGWVARRKPADPDRFGSVWLLSLVALGVTVAAVFYVYGPHQALAPEGRYLLLVLPLLAVLLVEGWQRFWSEPNRRLAAEVWVCGWIFLNLVVLFRYVVPLYYL